MKLRKQSVNMPKKSSKQKVIEYFENKRPTSLKSIAETTRTNKLKDELGELRYVTAHELHKLIGIKPEEIRKWHEKGLVRGMKDGGRWIYSETDVIKVIRKS